MIAEKPKVIMMFLKKSNSGIPSPLVTKGGDFENLLTAAKMTKAILQIKVNFDKNESTFINSND